MTTLDSALIRRTRTVLGLSRQTLARRCNIGWHTVEYLETDGRGDLGGISVGALFRLADALGLDPRDLIARPATPEPTPQDASGPPRPLAVAPEPTDRGERNQPAPTDAQVLATLLLPRPEVVKIHDLLHSLGPAWDTLRVRRAIQELNRHLDPVGVRVKRQQGENRIEAAIALPVRARPLTESSARRRGLPIDAYRLAYRALQGPVPVRSNSRHRFVVGHLVNLRVLEHRPDGLELTPAARLAFPDRVPPGRATSRSGP